MNSKKLVQRIAEGESDPVVRAVMTTLMRSFLSKTVRSPSPIEVIQTLKDAGVSDPEASVKAFQAEFKTRSAKFIELRKKLDDVHAKINDLSSRASGTHGHPEPSPEQEKKYWKQIEDLEDEALELANERDMLVAGKLIRDPLHYT